MTYLAWSYWTGPKPPWIAACLDSIRRHVPQALILDPDSWAEIRGRCDDTPDIDISHLGISQQTDYMRLVLLQKHGGAWLDADTLVLRPLDDLFRMLDTYDFMAARDEVGSMLTGLMFSRRNGVIANTLRQHQIDLLRKLNGVHPGGWGDLSVTPLTDIWDDCPEPLAELPLNTVMPIGWTEQVRHFEVCNDETFKRRFQFYSNGHSPYCYMMAHAAVSQMQGDILAPNTYFSHLVEVASGNR